MELILSQDGGLLAEIHRESFPHYWDSNAFTDFFAVSGTVAMVAVLPETAGMIVYRVAGEHADIITIAVRPGYRRRGIAAFLLTAALSKVIIQGAREFFLDVEEGNMAAIALYEKFGFTHIHRRKHYYKQKDGSFTDALVMQRKL